MGISAIRAALYAALAGTLIATGGCSRSTDTSADKTDKTAAPDTNADPAGARSACAKTEKKGPLAWFHDDYQAALACARATNRPIFIDLWAPWCHTCLAMQHSVLVDPGIAPLADRFVWLGIDTDRPENAAAQTKFPPQVWPTFYVVAPADESVQARFLGAASVAQLREFLIQGEKGFMDATQNTLPADSPLRLVRDGDRAVVAGELKAAAEAYGSALAKAPADWARRPDVLVSLISVLHKLEDWPGCVDLATEHMNSTGSSASATDFIYHVRKCAEGLAAGDGAEPAAKGGKLAGNARAEAVVRAAIARLSALVDDAGAPLSADDRSDAMANLRELYLDVGDEDAARAVAERQRALLDQAAAKAPTALAAMTYNWPRAEVYVYLGKGAELVPVLEKSAADLPNEYDPPYRLAWVYASLGEYDKALQAAEQAMKLIYGPRKGRAQALIASIYKAKGDKDAERAARQKVVEIYKALPEGQRSDSAIERAKAELAAVDEPAAK